MTTSQQRRSRRQLTGFTLIEMLVVMILMTLIGGVLFQALDRAYQLQERFGATLFNVQQGQMAADWYRQSVQGLLPDYPEGGHIFRGTAQEFSGLSTSTLSADFGSPRPITWRLRSDPANNTTELIYQNQQIASTILFWAGKQAQFTYIDDQLQPHDSWPPPLGQFAQLPSQIQIQIPKVDEIFTIVASPMGPVTPPLRQIDIVGDL